MKRVEEIYTSFIIESIHEFVDAVEFNPFNAIRSLQRVRNDWKVTDENRDCHEPVLRDIWAIESLLIDIAEAQARRNQELLNNYEQKQ